MIISLELLYLKGGKLSTTDEAKKLGDNFTRVRKTLSSDLWDSSEQKVTDFQQPFFLAFKHLQRVSDTELCKRSSSAEVGKLSQVARTVSGESAILSVPTQPANLYLQWDEYSCFFPGFRFRETKENVLTVTIFSEILQPSVFTSRHSLYLTRHVGAEPQIVSLGKATYNRRGSGQSHSTWRETHTAQDWVALTEDLCWGAVSHLKEDLRF